MAKFLKKPVVIEAMHCETYKESVDIERWVNANGDPRTPGIDMVEWIEQIPFTETRNYVQRVLENAVVYDLLYPQQARSPANGRLSYYLGRR